MKTGTASHYVTVVLRAIARIRVHLDEALDLGTCASDAGVTLRAGRMAAGEIYRNTPLDTPPEKLVTDMYLRLA